MNIELTRDVYGMCIVKVNGREVIRDNGDVISHFATPENLATPAAAAEVNRLLQDETQTADSKKLSQWFASKPDARLRAREAAAAEPRSALYDVATDPFPAVAAEPSEPSPMDLVDPTFNAIWNAIKGWDLSRDGGPSGYAGATGTDVMTILNALRATPAAAK